VLGRSCRKREVSKIIRTLTIVIKIEVRMLAETSPWMLKIAFVSARNPSNIVCRQVNAIVKPIVTMIRRRICLRNSCLN